MVDVGALVASQCDSYVSSQLGDAYQPKTLQNIIKGTNNQHVDHVTCHKGRLLHYYPPGELNQQESEGSESSSWCGWHNDHGALTALTSAMFLDPNGNEVTNPDPHSGLHVKSRHNEIKRLVVPRDHLAFQIGESAQILSGGILQATPHAVQVQPHR